MNILIILSSFLEMKGLLSALEEEVTESSRLFTKKMDSLEVDFFYSDPGIFSMSYFLTKQLQKKEYELVINAGIAGSFSEKTKIGTVVRIEKDCFADIGVEEARGFTDLFQMGLIDADAFPFKQGFLHEESGSFLNVISELPKAIAVTVNRIRTDKMTIDNLQSTYKADIETMEGAAFFYSCLMEKKNCIQLRAVSNRVGERDKNKWEFESSLRSLGEQIKIILNELQ